jgi:cyclic beta-1,2-glucan synthetase
LIGKMAHPLNRPKFCVAEQRIVEGFGILQPRVTPSLPIGRDGSLYQRVFSGPGGMDPYAAAVSDVYQDLFGEGSYTGKGIYDVEAFEASLAGRIPENALLSHDLFEGIFVRAGLASDIEVVEEFPSRYDVAARRQHRWTRGDWQLLPWIFRHQTGARAVPLLGRWKMLDNLRRSLVPPFMLAALAVSWLLPMPSAVIGAGLVLTAAVIPAFLPAFFSLVPSRRGVRLSSHLRKLAHDWQLASMQTFFSVAFLVDQAWNAGDAVSRTFVRLFATRRHLLEWATAAQSSGRPRLDLWGFYRKMAGGTFLAAITAAVAIIAEPSSWRLGVPFSALFLAAPALALWSSRSNVVDLQLTASDQDAGALRLIARRTWRFFETFVAPEDNMLPPDNFQEDPKPVLAHRTSPTNMGLYLLSAVAARDFGWAGTTETIERLEATLGTMQKLDRFKGHFFNWYDTRDLRVLDPAYVSSVDSGNLAGYLTAVANSMRLSRRMPGSG